MNFPRYKFAKETEPELLQFLKVAEEQKQLNRNIDLDKHKIWSKLLPLDENLMNKVNANDDSSKITVIDLASDEEPTNAYQSDSNDYKEEFSKNCDKSNINDIAFAVKENLETQYRLTDSLKDSLTNGLASDELEQLFALLDATLNCEEIFHFGNSIQDSISSILISLFCKSLLVPRIMKEYSDSLSTLIQQYSIKHSSALKETIFPKLHDIQEEEVSVFLQYMNSLNSNYKSVLFRDFIFSINSLNNNSLAIIENLINNQVEYEALNKLVEMLSNVAEEHSKDKSFGKLLMNTIQFLGSNVMLLEKPLKHIIAGHKSVWRTKLEKTFDNSCYEDNSMFTQSFRD